MLAVLYRCTKTVYKSRGSLPGSSSEINKLLPEKSTKGSHPVMFRTKRGLKEFCSNQSGCFTELLSSLCSVHTTVGIK